MSRVMEADKARHEVWYSLQNLKALMHAARESQVFEVAGMTGSVDDLGSMLRMAAEQVERAIEFWEPCEGVINAAVVRENNPDWNEPITGAVVADLIELLCEPKRAGDWYERFSSVATALARYAGSNPDLRDATFEELLTFGRRMGGDFRHTGGWTPSAKVAFHGALGGA